MRVKTDDCDEDNNSKENCFTQKDKGDNSPIPFGGVNDENGEINQLESKANAIDCDHKSAVRMKMMKGVVIRENGGPGVMKLQQLERPQVKNNEVLIKVAATSINRFDLRQRRGWLPKLKKGESAYPGIECSGEIIAVGAGVTQWKVGDQVCALVNRGGYAEEVVVPSGQLLSVPRSVSLEDAASLPVVACSVWLALFQIGKLSAGQTLLVRDGCSDFGIFAIQIAKYKGAKVLVIGGEAI
ncbi:oxidoreductase [Forsythia ovata]|uniref:Oxidoreductase n=1 Tax=Forsythia ovata TaxID=205694 RepID=A0ABD1NW59_9LAMI